MFPTKPVAQSGARSKQLAGRRGRILTVAPVSGCQRLLAILLVFALPGVALACSVPVFRYALEHWQPDAYRITLYHDQDLSDDDRQLLSWVREQTDQGANLEVRVVDLREEELEEADAARWEQIEDQATPRMVVQLPGRTGGGEVMVGSAPWNEQELQQLVASPARVELGQRLVDGEVVWLFLESGDDQTDDRLYQLLEEQLAIQQETLELPELEEQDRSELSGDPEELEIRFTAMRIARDDADEKWFREILLSVEPDLREAELIDKPMVFPAFGRARALYALVGAGINSDMIGQAAEFLTGACQCTVKADNPGVDLLIPVRWDNLIQVTEPEEVDLPLVGLGSNLPVVQESDMPRADGDHAPQADRDEAAASRPADEDLASRAAEETPGETDSNTTPAAGTAAGGTGGDLLASGDRSVGPSTMVVLPLIVLLVIGAVVALLGSSALRRG